MDRELGQLLGRRRAPRAARASRARYPGVRERGRVLDAVSHPIVCPHCGHHGEKSLGWLTEHPEFPCPGGCGATLRIVASDFAAAQRRAAPSEDLDLDAWSPKPSE